MVLILLQSIYIKLVKKQSLKSIGVHNFNLFRKYINSVNPILQYNDGRLSFFFPILNQTNRIEKLISLTI